MNTVLKIGKLGRLVKMLQELLGIKQDGQFGPKTKEAVLEFQRDNKIAPDGIVGPITWSKLDFNPAELEADTEVPTSATWIEQYRLPEGEYVNSVTSKKYIFLHHTAGRNNPYSTIDNWAKDQRGRIGTHYVIGGVKSSLNMEALGREDRKHDGKVLQAIDDLNWGFHLGAVESSYMHRHSISIELCSAGWLKERNGEFYTWYNSKVHPSQVAKMDKPFKGHMYYHKYTDVQIQSLKALLIHIRNTHGISMENGLLAWIKEDPFNAFDYKRDADLGKVTGLLSHGNVRTDKSDLFPQKELIEMLNTL